MKYPITVTDYYFQTLKYRFSSKEKLLHIIEGLRQENSELQNLLFSKEIIPHNKAPIYHYIDRHSQRYLVIKKVTDKVKIPVLGKKYCIGQIIEHGKYTSRVRLINDVQSKIPVYIPEFGQAILTGTNFSMKLEFLNPLPNARLPRKDDLIYAAGICGVYPKNTPLAKVTYIEGNKIEAQPLEDLLSLDAVTVMVLD